MPVRRNPLRRVVVSGTLAAARAPGLLAHGSRAAINGALLGLLSDDSLRAVDERYYDTEGVYRTPDWNERGLFDWERQAVEEHFGDGGRIVVAACGGGREVLALLDAGFDAVGYEPHFGLALYGRELLQERGHPDRIHLWRRDEFPSAAGRCDGVVVGWGAYSLIRGRERRVRFLAEARRHVPDGAPVLLSFFDRAADGREVAFTRAAANALRRVRGAEAVELGDTLAPNFVHVFTRAELAAELAAAGWELGEHRLLGDADGGTRYAMAVAHAR
jgi:hypothetical protein